MKTPLRIAVLECDTPTDDLKAKFGNYGDIFQALLETGTDALSSPDIISSKTGLDITKWNVEKEELYPQLDDIDAILISGSHYNAFDNDPWIIKLVDYVKKILEQDRIRIIGVCFGHQIIARAMGVKVDRSPDGWEVAVSTVDLTETGKQLFGKESLSIHQMHTDIVLEYPEGVTALGSSPKCAVQGMYAKNRLISVQGHPEFSQDIMVALLGLRHDYGVFHDAMYEEALSRAATPHDGVIVAQAFLRFLLED